METRAELDQGRTEQFPLLERKGGHYPPIADFGRKQGAPQGKGALTVCSRPGRHEGRGVGVGGERSTGGARSSHPQSLTRTRAAARSCTCSIPAGAFPGHTGRGVGRAWTFVQSCPREPQLGHQRPRRRRGWTRDSGTLAEEAKELQAAREAAADRTLRSFREHQGGGQLPRSAFG